MTAGAVVRAVSWRVGSGVSAPRKRIRQPWERRIEAEGEEADVVLLARGAGQQGERPRAAAPEPSQRDQSPADQVAREMLLADLDAALLPTCGPTAVRVGRMRFPDKCLKPKGRQPVVKGGLTAASS